MLLAGSSSCQALAPLGPSSTATSPGAPARGITAGAPAAAAAAGSLAVCGSTERCQPAGPMGQSGGAPPAAALVPGGRPAGSSRAQHRRHTAALMHEALQTYGSIQVLVTAQLAPHKVSQLRGGGGDGSREAPAWREGGTCLQMRPVTVLHLGPSSLLLHPPRTDCKVLPNGTCTDGARLHGLILRALAVPANQNKSWLFFRKANCRRVATHNLVAPSPVARAPSPQGPLSMPELNRHLTLLQRQLDPTFQLSRVYPHFSGCVDVPPPGTQVRRAGGEAPGGGLPRRGGKWRRHGGAGVGWG